MAKYSIESEDEHEFMEFMNGPHWKQAIIDFDSTILRPIAKFGDESAETTIYRELRTKLHTLFGEHGLSLYE